MSEDVCSNNYLQKFPHGPFRHMKVMDKLARCKYCNRLLCCVEHRINHENCHLSGNIPFKKLRGFKGRNFSAGDERNREWSLVNEANLTLLTKKVAFPLVCIYCKLILLSEDHLTALLLNGPQCLSKDSHWIVSIKRIEKLCKSENIRDRKAKRVSKAKELKTVQASVSLQKYTPVPHQDEVVQALKNLSAFLCTPEDQVSASVDVRCNLHEKNSLLKETLFFTSTPQYFMDNCVEMSFTPSSGQDKDGSLMKNSNDGKTSESSNFWVTFSQNVEIIKNKTGDAGLGNDCGNDQTHNDLFSADIDNVVCKDTDGGFEPAKLIKKEGELLFSGNDGGISERDNEDIDLKIKSRVKYSKFHDELYNQDSEIEKEVPHGKSFDGTTEDRWGKNYIKNSILDISSCSESFYSADESQINFNASELRNSPIDETQNASHFQEYVKNGDVSSGTLSVLDVHGNLIDCPEKEQSTVPPQFEAPSPDSENINTVRGVIESSRICEDTSLLLLKTAPEFEVSNFNQENPIPTESENINKVRNVSESSRIYGNNNDHDNLLELKNAQEYEESYLNQENSIPITSYINLQEGVVEKHSNISDVLMEEGETDDEGKCEESYSGDKSTVNNQGKIGIVDQREGECPTTSVCVNSDFSDNADGFLTHPQTRGPDLCDESVGRLIIDPSSSSSSHLSESDFETVSSSIDLQNLSNEKSNVISHVISSSAADVLQLNSPTEDSNSISVESNDSICDNLRGDSHLMKIATSLSSSWCMAKEFLSKSLGRKREITDPSDDELDNMIPEKKMKLRHSSSCTCSPSEFTNFPVRWKCHPKPVSVYDFKVKGRRPLSRMLKRND